MPALPLGNKGRESFARVAFQQLVQLGKNESQQAVAVQRAFLVDSRQIGDRLRDVAARGRRQTHVQADADDRQRGAERVTGYLDQNAADLAVTMDQVIRPFELDVLEAGRVQRAPQCNADRKRQAGEKTRALLEAPAQRKSETAAG